MCAGLKAKQKKTPHKQRDVIAFILRISYVMCVGTDFIRILWNEVKRRHTHFGFVLSSLITESIIQYDGYAFPPHKNNQQYFTNMSDTRAPLPFRRRMRSRQEKNGIKTESLIRRVALICILHTKCSIIWVLYAVFCKAPKFYPRATIGFILFLRNNLFLTMRLTWPPRLSCSSFMLYYINIARTLCARVCVCHARRIVRNNLFPRNNVDQILLSRVGN